jgi:hypothetical protein
MKTTELKRRKSNWNTKFDVLIKSRISKLESLEKVNFEISPEKLLKPIDK